MKAVHSKCEDDSRVQVEPTDPLRKRSHKEAQELRNATY